MGKATQKTRKLREKTFKGVKKKIGKKQIVKNQTRADVRIKPIKLIEQKALARPFHSEECVTSKKLGLTELMTQTRHYNNKVRVEAFHGLLELLNKFGEELRPSLGYLLTSVSRCIIDADPHVRYEYRILLERILVLLSGFPKPDRSYKQKSCDIKFQFSTPFKEQLGLQLSSCMTHRDASIRREAIAYLELLLSCDAVSLPVLRQILLSTPLRLKQTYQESTSDIICFFSLMDLVSDLYEECSFQALEYSRVIDLYVITQIALLILGFGNPLECPQSNDLVFFHSPEAGFVHLTSWLNKIHLLNLKNMRSEISPNYRCGSILRRFLSTLLSLLDQLKDVLQAQHENSSNLKRPMMKCRVTSFAMSHVKQVMYKFTKHIQDTDGHSTSLEASDMNQLYWLLPLILRRDLLYMITQVLKVTSLWTYKKSAVKDQYEQHSLREEMFDMVARQKDRHLQYQFVKRLIVHVFLEIGLGSDLVWLSDRLNSSVFEVIDLHIRLIVIEGCVWFLDDLFPVQFFQLDSAALCVGVLSQYGCRLPGMIHKAFSIPHLLRQAVLTLSTYISLIPSQIHRKTSLLYGFLYMIVQNSEKNSNTLYRHLQKAIYRIRSCNASSNTTSVSSLFNSLLRSSSYPQDADEMQTGCLSLSWSENIIDIILTEFPQQCETLYEKFQENVFLMLCDVCKALTESEDLLLSDVSRTSHLSSNDEPLRNVFHGGNADTEFNISEKKGVYWASHSLLCFVIIFFSIFKISLNYSCLENLVFNSRTITWTMSLIDFLQKHVYHGQEWHISPFSYIVLHSSELRSWLKKWFSLALRLERQNLDSNGLLCILLALTKSLGIVCDQPETKKEDRLKLNLLFKSLRSDLKNIFFQAPSTVETSPFISLQPASQITLFKIWSFLNSLDSCEKSNDAVQIYVQDFFQKLTSTQEISADVISYLNNSLAFSASLLCQPFSRLSTDILIEN